MKLKIAWVGKTKDASIQALTDEYIKRISRYSEAEGAAVKDEAAILRMCDPYGRTTKHTLVILDSQGKQLTSEDFAKFLSDYQDRNSQPLLLAIGPASGFSDEARRSASLILSLGKMTIAHELARIVLLEQIYRAFTIMKGHPYHLGHRG